MDLTPAERKAAEQRIAEANRLFALRTKGKTLVEIANERDDADEENMRRYFAEHPDDPTLKY